MGDIAFPERVFALESESSLSEEQMQQSNKEKLEEPFHKDNRHEQVEMKQTDRQTQNVCEMATGIFQSTPSL